MNSLNIYIYIIIQQTSLFDTMIGTWTTLSYIPCLCLKDNSLTFSWVLSHLCRYFHQIIQWQFPFFYVWFDKYIYIYIRIVSGKALKYFRLLSKNLISCCMDIITFSVLNINLNLFIFLLTTSIIEIPKHKKASSDN